MQETGERMIPEQSDPHVLWEHLYRYKFALPYARGRRVLDIACGEGYGSRALEVGGAAAVTGVDIAEEACRHARDKYGIAARVGDAAAIPLPDRSKDLVVSFETIEHVPQPEQFVRECARVLQPAGELLISTPNVETYNPERSAENNQFHCSEMSEGEFVKLLQKHFRQVRLFAQVPVAAPFWSLAGMLCRASDWRQVRGYHRLVASRFPGADPAREGSARHDPIAEITRKDSRLEQAINPYCVRPRRRANKIRPLYYVAVASGPLCPC